MIYVWIIAGVLLSALGPRRLRLVTHHQIDDAGVDLALEVVTEALRWASGHMTDGARREPTAVTTEA